MSRSRLFLAAIALTAAACSEERTLPRTLSSFEVTLTSSVGTPGRRCLLPGTPTTGADLTGCPTYVTDSLGNTVAKVSYTARAVDQKGELLETYNSEAIVRVLPGNVDGAFRRVRFVNGVAQGTAGRQPEAAFRGAFGDAYLWITDENPPPRVSTTPGLGTPCGNGDTADCAALGLACINTKPAVGYDPQGLAYCSPLCTDSCEGGYECRSDIVVYGGSEGDSACVRVQPSYAAGAAGPIHLVEPNLADVNRSDSLLDSPFEEQFVEIKRGNMVVTGVRIDGFYITDTCTIPDYPGSGQALCTEGERNTTPGFNHLFVFTFSRPDDLFVGDRLTFVSGPMTEFNGLSEIGFPLWEVDYDNSPQPDLAPKSLNDRLSPYYPDLLERGGLCVVGNRNPETTNIIQCDHAMERLEGARVKVRIRATAGISPGSREDRAFRDFAQWPVIADDGSDVGLRFQLVTRENLPFFDPLAFGAQAVNQEITGNLRQVVFNEQSVPLWIIEPRDQADCPWCVNR